MQVKLKDLTNIRFHRLFVIERAPNIGVRTYWKCKCDCGIIKNVSSQSIIRGSSKSCGCLNKEINSKKMKGNTNNFIHGLTNHPLRAIWKSMKDRCYNSKNKFYKNYGDRGIIVCDEWKESMPVFVKWALENGWVKGLSIDRINTNKNYIPENCQWITVSENSRKKKAKSL
jgi:hypothetical protein